MYPVYLTECSQSFFDLEKNGPLQFHVKLKKQKQKTITYFMQVENQGQCSTSRHPHHGSLLHAQVCGD